MTTFNDTDGEEWDANGGAAVTGITIYGGALSFLGSA